MNALVWRSRADIPRQDGRCAVITGTGGLGYEAALAFALAGGEVILAGRNSEKGAESVAKVRKVVPDAKIQFEPLDLATLASVRDFAGRVDQRGTGLDVLLNNAGIMSPPVRRTTVEGFELQFGVNYLAHFALTALLLPSLLRSSAPRVVSVTSLAHRYATMDFEDLQSERRYRPGVAYCRSKLAQALFALELQRRSARCCPKLTSNAAHPGYAATNLLQKEPGSNGLLNVISKSVIVPLIGQSAEKGALPLLFAATSPLAHGGALYGPTGFLQMKGTPGPNEFAPAACDVEAAARLWTVSEELAGVRFPQALNSLQ